MKTPYVCTETTTHRRIVSPTFASRGASAYQIKNQLIDSQSAEGSKTQIRNLQSAFRNRLYVHAALDYRRLSRIIGFEISPNSDRIRRFASPWGRGQGEGELFPCLIEPLVPIKNHLIINHKCSWSAHGRP